MEKINNDVILNVFDFIFPVRKPCVLQLSRAEYDNYSTIKLLNKYFYKLTNKQCAIHFVYKPLNNDYLTDICECNKHYDRQNNKINMINILNKFKYRQGTRKTTYEIHLDSLQECMTCLPYIKEYANVAYIKNDSNVIFLMNKFDRYSSMF
jgi:hypothetical protein